MDKVIEVFTFNDGKRMYKDEIAYANGEYVLLSDYKKVIDELEHAKHYITQLKHDTKEMAEKISELEFELEVKENLLKIKNGLCEDNGTAKINLNDTIKVKLTPYGAEIYYKQFDELNKQYEKEICKPHMPQIDKDGYTEFQLWHFIELYGEHIGMCKPNVIEPLEIIVC